MAVTYAPYVDQVACGVTPAEAKAQKPFTVELVLLGVVQGGTDKGPLLNSVELGPSISKFMFTGGGGGGLLIIVDVASVEVATAMTGEMSAVDVALSALVNRKATVNRRKAGININKNNFEGFMLV